MTTTTTTTTGFDFAHNDHAEQNRIAKARKIARLLYDLNVPLADLTAAVQLGDMPQLREWANTAEVNVPKTMSTWQAAIDALTELEAWAADPRNATHPRAARRAPVAPEIGPGAPESLVEVPVVQHVVKPRGWDALVAAGPLDRKDARCTRHPRRPAVTCVPVAGARSEWRCGDCPPQPGEWGAALDWTPRPDASLAFHTDGPHRCYNARCPQYRPA